MARINTGKALRLATKYLEINDYVTANKILEIVSREITRRKKANLNSRIIELSIKKDIVFFETVLKNDKHKDEIMVLVQN